jgi:hypothetical protein
MKVVVLGRRGDPAATTGGSGRWLPICTIDQ